MNTHVKTVLMKVPEGQVETVNYLLKALEKRDELSNPPQQQEQETDLIPHKQALDMLKMSRVGLYKMRVNGKVPFYRLGSKIYFRKSEILASMKHIDLSEYQGEKYGKK